LLLISFVGLDEPLNFPTHYQDPIQWKGRVYEENDEEDIGASENELTGKSFESSSQTLIIALDDLSTVGDYKSPVCCLIDNI